MSKGNSGLFKGTKGSVADEWGWLIPDSSPSPAYLALVSGKNKSKSSGSASIGMVLSFKDSDSVNSSKMPSSLAWHSVADDQDDDNNNEPWHQLPSHDDDNEPWQQVPVHDDEDDDGDNNGGDNDDASDDDGTNDNNGEGGDENNDSDDEQDDYSELESYMHQLVMEWAKRKFNELPKEIRNKFNTACIVYYENKDSYEDKDSYFFGRNGGYLEEQYERNPIIFGDESHEGILPNEQICKYPIGNCAEVDAVNRALNANAKLESLFMLTIHTTKRRFGDYKESCENCEYTFKGRIKHNFSGWKDGNINHEQ